MGVPSLVQTFVFRTHGVVVAHIGVRLSHLVVNIERDSGVVSALAIRLLI